MKWLIPLLLAGCSGGAFEATLLEATPQALDPSHDESNDLTLRVRYQHPSALLGDGTALVHDCRADGLTTRLAIPPIASQEAKDRGVPIAGELTLLVPDVGRVSALGTSPACALAPEPSTTDRAVFCVVLVDTTGTEAPAGCTSPISIAP
jgi:hypothetical protein